MSVRISLKRLIYTSLSILAYCCLGLIALHLIKQFNALPTNKNTLTVENIRWQDCWFNHSDPVLTTRCGWLNRPGKNLTYQIPIVVIESQPASKELSKSPLVYLGGGPGAGLNLSEQGIHHWLGWYERYQLSQPLILADYRSTGMSQPGFDCAPYVRAYEQSILNFDRVDAHDLHHSLKQCFQIWVDRGFDITDFSAQTITNDYHAIIKALNHPSYDIYAVSYGTRIAVQLSELDKNSINKIVLDSPVNPNWVGVNSWPKRLAAGLEQFYDYCATNTNCSLNEQLMLSWLQQLKHKPLITSVLINNIPLTVKVNDHLFLSALLSNFNAFISTHNITNKDDQFGYKKVKQVDRDPNLTVDHVNLTASIQQFIANSLDQSFNYFTYFASSCTDNKPFNQGKYTYTELSDFWHDYVDYNREFDICNSISSYSSSQGYSKPFTNVKTLMLSGGLDSVTPVVSAIELMDQSLNPFDTQVKLAVFPHIGHGVSESSLCGQELVTQFLKDNPVNLKNMSHCQQGSAYIYH